MCRTCASMLHTRSLLSHRRLPRKVKIRAEDTTYQLVVDENHCHQKCRRRVADASARTFEVMSLLWRFQGVLLALLILLSEMSATKLWCYECNANLTKGHNGECNDPYAPGPAIDLVACPENEPHCCLKALVSYKNVHVTVRACVEASSAQSYCDFHQAYPDAIVSCTFCHENACNRSRGLGPPSSPILLLTTLIACNLLALM